MSAEHTRGSVATPGASVVALFFRLLKSASSCHGNSHDSNVDTDGPRRLDRGYRELEKAVQSRVGKNKSARFTPSNRSVNRQSDVSRSNSSNVTARDLLEVGSIVRDCITCPFPQYGSFGDRILHISSGRHLQPGIQITQPTIFSFDTFCKFDFLIFFVYM